MVVSFAMDWIVEYISLEAVTFYNYTLFLDIVVRRFGFDWHNPIGYVAAFSIQVVFAMYALCELLFQTNFLIGSCWMLVSLVEDITSELQTLNKVMENQYEYTEKFSKYIQLNFKAKEFRKIDCIELRLCRFVWNWLIYLYFRLVQAYEYNIMIHSLWSTITICGTMLMFQMEMISNKCKHKFQL